MWPGGVAALRRLFDNARCAAIGAAAAPPMATGGGAVACRVTNLQHGFALSVLASDTPVFSTMNEALRTGGEELSHWCPFVALLRDALLTLPPMVTSLSHPAQAPGAGLASMVAVQAVETVEVYRRVPCPFDKHLFAVGRTLSWAGFVSATTRWATVLSGGGDKGNVHGGDHGGGGGVIFCIQSRSARDISPFSTWYANAEVVLLPRVEYRVKGWFQCDRIAFGQPNCRYTAYRVTQEVLDGGRAAAGRRFKKGATIVVELEELEEH